MRSNLLTMKKGNVKRFSGSLNLILCVIARFFRRKNRGNPVKTAGFNKRR
ncbi:MAG: hypothetical protein IKI11_01735 [Neisseriaceae bacterium]|nr:hypothetical protein [Neisseriaceae bacterium]MBR7001373.1 hypothetical protein [Neisseriaceae bacterium]